MSSNDTVALARQEAFKDFSYFDEETVPANVHKPIRLQPLKATSSIILTGYIPENASSISRDRRAVRILGRRYALTATGYKFLEIGINVGPPSYVEIAVGDHRGKELLLSLETWKALYEQRRNIQNFFRNDYKDVHSFINVGPLTVRVCTSVNNVKLIRLESANVRLMMTESTLRRMFDLDRCIEARFDRLVRILATVDAKFAQFSDIASTVTDPKEASNVIYASDAFNTNQLIDCELAALVF
ncbi:uncharacterized protein [Temnothorax nylanderi]|uniref:uncharacterized protein isoform X2 n=1 Tax=Temnothorax nylanderi TaxID=102681 RepID=UPI003A85B91D